MLTNELNLPEPLVRALERDDYSRGESHYTVTELITPPRIAELRRQHGDKLVSDASDRIFALFGRAIHTILEKAASDRYMVEQRFYVDWDGVKVGGQIDLYDREEKVLSDWKITSRWAVAEGAKEEWIAQGNLNKYILWKNGIEVKKVQYVAIFRDWSKIQAGLKSDYPPRQVAVLDLPLWSRAETENYLAERIALHRAASAELPLCNPRERWARPDRFAVMKKGQKRAVKLYDEEDQAKASVKDGERVEIRAGSNVRCVHYCDCLPWCSQGRELVQEECQS